MAKVRKHVREAMDRTDVTGGLDVSELSDRELLIEGLKRVVALESRLSEKSKPEQKWLRPNLLQRGLRRKHQLPRCMRRKSRNDRAFQGSSSFLKLVPVL